MIGEFVHLTWRGRVSMTYYAFRSLFAFPAVDDERCVMGSPVGSHVWCPRRRADGGMWCPHHLREINRRENP